jgi:hypothetical protein
MWTMRGISDDHRTLYISPDLLLFAAHHLEANLQQGFRNSVS